MDKKRSILSIIDRVILCITIAHEGFFFSINAILGKEYLGSGESSIYRVFLASLVIYLFIRLIYRVRTVKSDIIKWLAVPIIFLLGCQITKKIYGDNDYLNNSMLYIAVWQYMAILLSINLLDEDTNKDVRKYFKYIVIILSIAVALVSIKSYFAGHYVDSIGGATYQSASYYAAFCFGMLLYYMQFEKRSIVTKVEKAIYIFLLIIDFLALILSGGRGAMILLIVYGLFSILGSKRKGKVRSVLLIAILVVVVTNILSRLDTRIVGRQLQRIFSYITSSGIDLTQTSGRNVYYQRCLQYIQDSPIIGHGFASYYYLLDGGYPHNFFLEILLEGGIFYLLVWGFIFYRTFRHGKQIITTEEGKFEINIGIYPLCFLLFSGTYSYSFLFWFFISYISMKHIERCRRDLKL